MAVVVIDGFVPGGAVVPHGEVAGLPADTALEFGFLAMVVEHCEDGAGFVCGEAFDMGGEAWVDVEAAAAAERVGDDDGVAGVLGGGAGVGEAAGFGGFAVFDGGTEGVSG